jgi:hypothetical protein
VTVTRVELRVVTLNPDQGNKSPFGNLKIGEVSQPMFDAEFEQWWKAYPKRVGRIAAQAAFRKVRKRGVPFSVLLVGIEAYRQMKPSYADWCHPTTWLNQGRWMDEVDDPQVRPCRRCGMAPKCQSYAECNERLMAKRQQAAS